MKLPESEIIVLDLAGDYARVACHNPDGVESLMSLGFHLSGDQFIKAIADDLERQKMACNLIELSAVFSAGRDWSPAELLEYYREQGVFRKAYRVISWKGKDNFQIRDC